MTVEDIVFHITLGDMPIEESFYVDISIDTDKTISDLLNDTFPESREHTTKMLNSLDHETNPDIPEMYLELHKLVANWRKGTTEIDITSSASPEASDICIEDPVSKYIQSLDNLSNTIWLVVVQRFDALAAYQHHGGNQNDLIRWMQGCVLLYFMDKHLSQVPLELSRSSRDWQLDSIAKTLEVRGFLSVPSSNERYAITPRGRTFIGNLITETESYIRRYDLFSDILPSPDEQPPIFSSGRGIDLRVPIFTAEGIDPYRAVFLLQVYDGTLDIYKDSWRKNISEIEFFNKLLQPIVDHASINDYDLNRLIEDRVEHINMAFGLHKEEIRHPVSY